MSDGNHPRANATPPTLKDQIPRHGGGSWHFALQLDDVSKYEIARLFQSVNGEYNHTHTFMNIMSL